MFIDLGETKFKVPNVTASSNDIVSPNIPDLGSIIIEESAIRLSVLEQSKVGAMIIYLTNKD